MWLNERRQTVAMWELEQGDSRCPLCGRPLVARRGDWVRWHWAHAPKTLHRAACPWEETAWHLTWKLAYMESGWQIEYPWTAGGRRFVLDACNPAAGVAVEFVHSLSPYYVDKHLALRRSGLTVRWIWDGEAHASARRKPTADCRGWKRLMKARAFEIYQGVGGKVHLDAALWEHWKANVWYERTSDAEARAVDAFVDIQRRSEEQA